MGYNISTIRVVNAETLDVSHEGFEAASEILGEDWHYSEHELKQAWAEGWMETGGEYLKEDALVKALQNFSGAGDFILVWEGGDSFTGLRLRDEVVTRHDVNFELQE